MRTTRIFGIFILLTVGLLVLWTFSSLDLSPTPASLTKKIPDSSHRIEENSDLQKAERLVNAFRSTEALDILSDISPTIDLSNQTGQHWLRLLIDAYAAMHQQESILYIYHQFPDSIDSNEHAALMVAEALISYNDPLKYNLLRKPWQGKEKEPIRWIFLDAQSRILQGKPEEAITILEANRFNGKSETDRLIRLAAFYMIENPERSWDYLTKAIENDPENTDLYTFKASLSEAQNENQTAQSNYIMAIQHDPASPYLREQLADFYLRTKQYKKSLDILQDTSLTPSLDSIWLKMLFWSRLIAPLKEIEKGQEIPEGNFKDLAVYIQNLPEGIYWDPNSFNKLPNSGFYLNTRQETFWLQLLSALKTGQEESALNLLNHNTFQHISWAPQLKKSLKTLLTYRLSQKANVNRHHASTFPLENPIESPQQLLNLLSSLSEISAEQLHSAIPYSIQDPLLSLEAFMMLFLAADWPEAAIQLYAFGKIPDSFPNWVGEAFTQALNQNRDYKTAWNFAVAQKSRPSLSLLIAEIALAANEKEIAFNTLKTIYTKDDVSGQSAALMLGEFLIEHHNLQDAKKALMAQPALAHDVRAQEMLAYIALQEGDLKKANAIYLELEKDSAAAKSFLARKAFTDKDWMKARQLTEALLKEYPENSILKDNLSKIALEDRKKSNPAIPQ